MMDVCVCVCVLAAVILLAIEYNLENTLTDKKDTVYVATYDNSNKC